MSASSNVPSRPHTFVFSRLQILFLLLFLLLASLYHTSVPLGEGPDEPGHFSYVLFLAREQHLPIQRATQAESDVPGQGHQPPLAYLLMTPAVSWLTPEQQTIDLSANPRFLWNNGSEPGAFMRASREYWPWEGLVLAWHLARIISTLFGALTLLALGWAVDWTLQALVPTLENDIREKIKTLAMGLLACTPQFLFLSVLVTNDLLLALLCTVIVGVGMRMLALGNQPTLRSIVLLSALFGLALLTKQSALALLPFLVWVLWQPYPRWRLLARNGATFAAIVATVAGWWFVRNTWLYGDLFGLGAFREQFTTQAFNAGDPHAWLSAIEQLYASAWARFGWMSLAPPRWVTICYGVLGLTAVSGLLLDRKKKGLALGSLASSSRRSVVALALVLATTGAWVLFFAWQAGLVAWQGRMLIPALPALYMLLAMGLYSILKRWVYTLILFLAVLATWLPLGLIAPAYSWYAVPPAQAEQKIAVSSYVRYAATHERGVELRGWRLTGNAEYDHGSEDEADVIVQAGQTVTLTLTWHALERVPRNWEIFVHLINADRAIIAQDDRRPFDGRFGLMRWTPGDWVETQHPLIVPANLPPGLYKLRVGLFLPEHKGRRQLAWSETGGRRGDSAQIGIWRVEIPSGR